MAPRTIAILLLLAPLPLPFLSLAVASAEGQESLELGTRLKGRFEPAKDPSQRAAILRRFPFVPKESDLYSVSLESYDFDVRLRVLDPDGEVLVEDNDGGVETNAWLVFRGYAGRQYELEVSSINEEVGDFELSIVRDRIPFPSGQELTEVSIEYRRRAANRALRRDDKKNAAAHCLALGEMLSSQARYEDAIAVLEEGVDLAREIVDRRAEVRGLEGLGYCHLGRRESEAALERFRDLGELARAHELREEELRGQQRRARIAASIERVGEWEAALERQLALARALGRSEEEAEAHDQLCEHWAISGNWRSLEATWLGHLEFCLAKRDLAASARARLELGALYHARGETSSAYESATRARAELHSAGERDTAQAARATVLAARCAAQLGKGEEASRLRGELDAELAKARAQEDEARELTALAALAEIDVAARSPEAGKRVKDLYDLARAGSDAEAHVTALELSGALALGAGKAEEGRDFLRRAIELARANGLAVAAARARRSFEDAAGRLPAENAPSKPR